MCGIVGLFAKSPAIEDRLGEHLAAMLRQMNDRGPDSAGVAVYRDPVAHGHSKLVLCSPRADEDWQARSAICSARPAARRCATTTRSSRCPARPPTRRRAPRSTAPTCA